MPIIYQTRIYCENMYISSKDKSTNTEKQHLINAANSNYHQLHNTALILSKLKK